MRIFHITSPESAVAIVHSGTFYPFSTAPLNNDNGLNCFSYRPGYRTSQCFVGKGAKLICEWSGPVEVTHQYTAPPLQINVLHDQHPWRCFIRGGSNPKLLRVVDVRINEEEIDSLLDIPLWQRWLPYVLREKLKRKAKLNFLRTLRDRYRNNQLFLEVAGSMLDVTILSENYMGGNKPNKSLLWTALLRKPATSLKRYVTREV